MDLKNSSEAVAKVLGGLGTTIHVIAAADNHRGCGKNARLILIQPVRGT
jgi:hypothetical protein